MAHIPTLHPHPHIYSALARMTLVTSMILFRIRFGYGFVAHPPASFKVWREREDRLKRRLFVTGLGQLADRWRGKKESVPPLEQHHIPILLIHSRQDPLIPFSHAQTIATAAKLNRIPLETYFVDAASHCGAYGANPVEYCRVIRDFLSRTLGAALPEKHGELTAEDLPYSPSEFLSQ